MAHEISTIFGVPTIAYLGATPWHELGRGLTADESRDLDKAIGAAGLGAWNVRTEPLYFADGRLNEHAKGVVRGLDNEVLGAVGPETQVVQNEEAFSILEPLVKEFGASVEVAGALGRGERVWALVRLPDAIEPVPGDLHQSYLLLRHSHDNSSTLEGIPTDIRVVCANTMRAAVDNAGGNHSDKGRIFRLKKTASVQHRIADAKNLVRGVAETMARLGETFHTLAERKVTPEEIATYIESVFQLPRDAKTGKERDSKAVTERRKEVARQIFTSPGAVLAGSNIHTGSATAYGLLNAVTYYFDHIRPQEAHRESAKRSANESAVFGQNAAIKLLALAKARELVGARETIAA